MGESVQFDLMKYDFLLEGSSYRFMLPSSEEIFDEFHDVHAEMVERLQGQFCLTYGREDGLAETEIELVLHYELLSDDTIILAYLMEVGAWDIREKKPQFGPLKPPGPPPDWLLNLGKLWP
jgi:hypothetical protein